MKKYEYLYRLDKALNRLSESEKEDAMRYYEDYIEDAGLADGDAIEAKLGSPESLADTIIKNSAGGTESETNSSTGEHTQVSGEHDRGGVLGNVRRGDLPEFDSIDGEVVNAAIHIERADSYGIEWDPGDENSEFSYSVEDGVLKFRERRKKNHTVRWAPFGSSGGRLVLYLPEKPYRSVNVKTTNGSINVSAVSVELLHAATVNGSVKAIDGIFGNIEVSNVNGSVKLENNKVTDKVKASCVNGSIRLAGMLVCDIEASTVNGSVSVDTGLMEDSYNYSLSTLGSIRINGNRPADRKSARLSYKADNGASYSMNLESVHGSIKVECMDVIKLGREIDKMERTMRKTSRMVADILNDEDLDDE